MAKKAKRRPAPTKPAPARRDGFGIVGPYGNVWSIDVFDTPSQAERHLADFWRGIDRDLTKFKIVRVRASIAYLGEI